MKHYGWIIETMHRRNENYKAGGKWRLFYEFSEKYAKMRPETPAYPVITSSFEKAVNDILDGGDVQDTLDKAVEAIKKFHAKTGIPLDYDLKGLKESVFKINFSKPLVDNFDAWNGKKIKVGRNVIKGYPVDIDDSDGTFLEMTAVDADAAKGLMKIMREAGFIVKIARGKELSVDMPAKPGDRV
jgi:hypothetical protein